MSLDKDESIVIASYDVQVWTDILNDVIETNMDCFQLQLDKECTDGPISGVSEKHWDKEVDLYFKMYDEDINNDADRDALIVQLEKVAMITKGHIVCNAVRLQNNYNL